MFDENTTPQERLHFYRERITELKAEVERLWEAARWRPISEAPKDGTHILGITEDSVQVECWWEAGEPDGVDTMGMDSGWHSYYYGMVPGRTFGNPEYFREPVNQPVYFKLISAPSALQGIKEGE